MARILTSKWVAEEWRIYWNTVFGGSGQCPFDVSDAYAKDFALWLAEKAVSRASPAKRQSQTKRRGINAT